MENFQTWEELMGNSKTQVKGQCVDQDNAEAVKLLQLEADQGDVIAQYDLGIIYNNGLVVSQDNAEAAKWYKLVD